MNISLTIDDNGNPIFSQEGVMDIDSVIRDVLMDQEDLKDMFTAKFKKLAESIKINNDDITNSISEGVTQLFAFSDDFKQEVGKSFNEKIKGLLGKVSIDEAIIGESINSLFTYLDSSSLSTQGFLTKPTTDAEDTSFEAEPTSVNIMGIAPSVLKDLRALQEGIVNDPKDYEVDSKKFNIFKMISGALGIGGVGGATIAGLKSAALLNIKSSFAKLPTSVLKFATNPITLIGAGVIWGVMDALKAGLNADEWGTSKLSAQLGGFFAGSTDGMFANMGKWALIGAGVGSAIPVVGTIAGGLLGAILGGVINAIGPEKIAESFDELGDWYQRTIGVKITEMVDKVKDAWGGVVTWYDVELAPTLDNFKVEMGQIFDRVKGAFNRAMTTLAPVMETISEFLGEKWEDFVWGVEDFFGMVREFFGGVFTNAKERIKEEIDSAKAVITSIGDGIVEVLGGLPAFINASMDQTKLYINNIKTSIDTVTKFYGILEDKLAALIEKVPWMRESESKALDNNLKEAENNIKELNDAISDKRNRLMRLNRDLEKAKDKENEADMARAKLRIEEVNAEILSLDKQRQGSLGTRNKILDRQRQKEAPIKGHDVYTTPKKLQIQLDEKDTMESFGTSQVYSKEGGTLDKAITELSKKTDLQIKTLTDTLNSTNSFNDMFKGYLDSAAGFNAQLIDSIGNIGGAAPLPADGPIPQGYIRDPNYEFRMRMREANL